MFTGQSFDSGAGVVVTMALCMVGVTDFRTSTMLYGLQSIVLGLLACTVGLRHGEPILVAVGLAVAILKGLAAPAYLAYAARRIGCRRDVGMIVAPPLQLFLAVAVVSLILLLRPLRAELPINTLPAIAVVMLGMALMMTRRLAVSQIVGFLVLENGMFLYTIAQPHPMPVVVEIGVLMDVLAGVMLAGLLAFRINRTFEHIDVTELKELRG